MGMLGARELLQGESPLLQSTVERLASRAGVVKPQLYVLSDGYPRALSAGRGAGGGSWDRSLRRADRRRVARGARGDRRPRARPPTASRRPRPIGDGRARDVAARELSRVGGALQRALLTVYSARCRQRSSISRSRRSARVRGRSSRGAPVRLTARPRRCTASSFEQAMQLVGEFEATPQHRAALHDEPVRREGSRRALRLAPAAQRTGEAAARARSGLARAAPSGVAGPRQRARHPMGAWLVERNGRRPTLPGACAPSTIGANRLDFSVRNGKRYFPVAKTAQLVRSCAMSQHPQNSIATKMSSSNQDLEQLVRVR